MSYRKGTKVYFKSKATSGKYRKGAILSVVKIPNCRYKEYRVKPSDGQTDIFWIKASNVRRRKSRKK